MTIQSNPNQVNINRALDLQWKQFHHQVGRTQKYTDQITVVLGSSVAAVGLILRLNQAGDYKLLLSVSVLCLLIAFVSAIVAWWPRAVPYPSDTDVDKLWERIVDPKDEESAANLLRDISGATETERGISRRIAYSCMATMGFSGLSVIFAICSCL